jgi:hypothetical protein
MRMPVLSYFLAVGSVLFAILTFVSSEIDPNISAIHVSQIVGVPAPFKAPPEEQHQNSRSNGDPAQLGMQLRGV